MKQTYSKYTCTTCALSLLMSSKHRAIRAHVVHVYSEYVCFMFASSCKQSVRLALHVANFEARRAACAL